MHNGCLLLLAFVAVLQPIASYTERGLVDGRQQRCDYRTSLRDPGVYFHGTYSFAKPAVEDHRLSKRKDIHEVRRNEVRGETLRTASSSDRRLVDILQRNRNTLTRPSRDRVGNDAVLRREIREGRLIANYRDERNQNTRERLSAVQESHQAHRLSCQDTNKFEDRNCHQSRIDNRRCNEPSFSMESRRDTRRNGNDAGAQRVREQQETRPASNRARNDVTSLNERRIAREDAQGVDTRRSVSRIQFNRNVNREVREQRARNIESTSNDRVNRAYHNEDSRSTIRDDMRSLDVEHRTTGSRRSLDDQQRDISRIQHQRLTAERRNIRDISANYRNSRDHHDRASENRKDTQFLGRSKSTERNARLRSVRSVDDRLSQNDRNHFHIFERARSAEAREDLRKARSMNEIQSLQRSAENRVDSQRSDRARALENRNEIHEIERESQSVPRYNRAPAILRDIRNVASLNGDVQVRGETWKNNKDTCAFDRVRLTEHRMPKRAALSEKNSQNIESEIRTHGLERAADNRRDTHDVERTILVRRHERVRASQQDAKIQIRSINRQRSQENRRDTRDVKSQAFRTQHADESRRVFRNIDSRAFITERIDEIRRQIRNAESRPFRAERTDESRIRNVDLQAFRKKRTDENRRVPRNVDSRVFRSKRTDENRRDIRNVESRAFRTARTDENRRVSRNVDSGLVRSERNDESRRDIRNVESRTFGTARTDEKRRNYRNVDSRLVRSERNYESRRDTRDIDSQAFRTERKDQNRPDARNVDSRALKTEHNAYSRLETGNLERRARSLERVADYHQDSRNNERDAHLQVSTLESRRNIRNTERQSRTENELVNNNRRARTLARESRSLGREKSMESRLNTRKISRDSRTFVLERRLEVRRVQATENRRGTQNNREESRSSDTQKDWKVDSRVNDLVRSRDATERLSKRDSSDTRRNNNLQQESRRETQRTSKRNNMITLHIDAESRRSFNTEFARKRELHSIFRNPIQPDEEAPTMNWQYLFYTLQGLYICGVLIQMMDEKSVLKKTRASWWPVSQHLIKVD